MDNQFVEKEINALLQAWSWNLNYADHNRLCNKPYAYLALKVKTGTMTLEQAVTAASIRNRDNLKGF
ncbi:hypothetical protein AAKU67_004047 [Oxalobacteraceae bacterium GrIS 2.11]